MKSNSGIPATRTSQAINVEYKIVSGFCITIGLLYFALIYYALGLPSGQRFDAEAFFFNYGENQLVMNILWFIMAVNSLATLFVIPLIHRILVNQSDIGHAIKISAMGGLIISSTSFLTMISRAPSMAAIYVNYPEARKAIEAVHLPQLDPMNVVVLGLPALWYLLVNIAALRNGRLNRLHAIAGIALGLGMMSAVIAQVLQMETLDQIAAGAGAVLAPLWFLWMGFALLRK